MMILPASPDNNFELHYIQPPVSARQFTCILRCLTSPFNGILSARHGYLLYRLPNAA
jgi:hypothetical protein